MAQRMDLWRLENFALERLPSAPDVYLFHAQARDNERDERLVAVAEVRDLTPARDDDRPDRRAARPRADRPPGVRGDARRPVAARPPRPPAVESRAALRLARGGRSSPTRPREVITRLARMSDGLGIEMVQLRVGDRVLRFFNPAGRGVVVEVGDPPTRPLQPLDEGGQPDRLGPPPRHGPPGRDRQDPHAAAPAARRGDPARRVHRVRPRRRRAARGGRAPGRHATARASWSG